MATAADKKRWDDLRARYAEARAATAAYESKLRAHYGPYEPSWLKKSERDKLDRLNAKDDKLGDQIVELLVRISPRGERWRSGVPAWWLRERLTWEDAIRPADEQLSVVVPGSYGYPDGYVQENEATTMAHMNAKRRSAPKGRGGSSGGANPRSSRQISEEQHEEAMRILRAEYYGAVRGIVRDLADRLKAGDISDWHDAIHDTVDGSYWVIYTHANFQVLLCSDNHDAYMEDMGQVPAEGDSLNWAALAFGALYRDVQQQLEAEGVGPDSETPEPGDDEDFDALRPPSRDQLRRSRSAREDRSPRGLRRR